jgi:hypothetical protein
MAFPQTQVPNTQHTVFYAHSIHVNGVEIGSFERMSVSSTRTTERIREILFSRGPEVKEIVWGGTDINVSLGRVELYNNAMLEAFGLSIFTIEDFNQPVNITEIQFNPNNNGQRTITYIDCVASDISKDIDQGTVRIVESMTFQVRTIRGTRTT